MNEEICCISKKEKWKMAINEWENGWMIFFELYTVYIKKFIQFIFHTYSLTCLNKDTSVQLKVSNIWTSSQVKYKNNALNFFKKYYVYVHNSFNKVIKS